MPTIQMQSLSIDSFPPSPWLIAALRGDSNGESVQWHRVNHSSSPLLYGLDAGPSAPFRMQRKCDGKAHPHIHNYSLTKCKANHKTKTTKLRRKMAENSQWWGCPGWEWEKECVCVSVSVCQWFQAVLKWRLTFTLPFFKKHHLSGRSS